ncbi:MAG: ABC transporter ATP-binding protein [Chloroflexi bacterium]|nr:ABC transporter ATP-binding protein [Chloroflexota bacterium]
MNEPLLSVENLKTHFFTRAGVVKAVDGVSFTVQRGEALGIVGESGSGKSITSLSIVGLVPQPAGRIVAGKIVFDGEDLATKSQSALRAWRGKRIAMILQDPLMSLNPVYSIGDQVAECFRLDGNRAALAQRVIEVLGRVNIPAPARRLNHYPFQFSGGMRQRTVAAMAISRSPELLIADEPTTSLDVTIQDQFLRLLKDLQVQNNMALILITHDLGIVAESCDRIAIMYAGRIVECGTVKRLYENPAHPYTRALMLALPRLGRKEKRLYQIEGEPPNLAKLPSGCSFAPRCPAQMEICRAEYPPAVPLDDGGQACCWRLGERGTS